MMVPILTRPQRCAPTLLARRLSLLRVIPGCSYLACDRAAVAKVEL